MKNRFERKERDWLEPGNRRRPTTTKIQQVDPANWSMHILLPIIATKWDDQEARGTRGQRLGSNKKNEEKKNKGGKKRVISSRSVCWWWRVEEGSVYLGKAREAEGGAKRGHDVCSDVSERGEREGMMKKKKERKKVEIGPTSIDLYPSSLVRSVAALEEMTKLMSAVFRSSSTKRMWSLSVGPGDSFFFLVSYIIATRLCSLGKHPTAPFNFCFLRYFWPCSLSQQHVPWSHWLCPPSPSFPCLISFLVLPLFVVS